MKTIILFLFIIISTLSFGQTTAQWKGGTPGNPNSWHEAKNWDNNRVPDEYTFVVIEALNTGHQAHPVIDESVEVAGIEIYGQASLTITNAGEILIDGSFTYTNGIVNYGGKIFNAGVIQLNSIEGYSYKNLQKMMIGEGHCILDGLLLHQKSLANE